MNRHFLVIIIILAAFLAESQSFMRPNEWKKYRREIFVTVGSSHFLGDLGGRDREGTDYSPLDLDFGQTRSAAAAGGRFKLDRALNVAAKISYLNVKGDDNATKEPARNNRNLNFKANVWELTSRIELGYQTTRRGGNRYGIVQSYGRGRQIQHNLFGFIGIGVFYFNPKGNQGNGWVKLYPLHTEGQGLPGGPKQYKRISFSIPMGGYYKLTYNKIWSFGAEFCYRKTFTDYIDDVGAVYYDNKKLEEAYGPLAAQMADPSKGNIPGATLPATDGTPAQRGDRQRDSFVSLEFTVGYIFKKQRRSARLRSKF
jgi:hypothetical protein